MKTVLIYSDINGEIEPTFYILDDDYSHLNGIYINFSEDADKVIELTDLIFDSEGKYKLEDSSINEITNFIRNTPYVTMICCGFVN